MANIPNNILNQMDQLYSLKQKIKALKAKRDQFQIDLDAVKAQIQADQAAFDALDAQIQAAIKALP